MRRRDVVCLEKISEDRDLMYERHSGLGIVVLDLIDAANDGSSTVTNHESCSRAASGQRSTGSAFHGETSGGLILLHRDIHDDGPRFSDLRCNRQTEGGVDV